MNRFFLAAAALLSSVTAASAQKQTYSLAESFDEKNVYRVELKSSIAGKITIVVDPAKPPQVVEMTGSSNIVYDERSLPVDEEKLKKSIRAYRIVEFGRTIGGSEQKATIREGVRRMVVLRAENGKKGPFSPDGPLTYGEIDIVKNDLFSPSLVPGLLPPKTVAVGDTWSATPAAVTDLTDNDAIAKGELKVTFAAVVKLNDRPHAKLTLQGTIEGANEDGPNRQTLDGTAYFDLDRKRLGHLKLSGVQELLDSKGKTTGKIEGTFTMTREEATKIDTITGDGIKGVSLNPNDDNTPLLYDRPDLGLKLTYPRRWRIGTTSGPQVNFEEPGGGGVLFTMLAAKQFPTAKQFREDVKSYLAKKKLRVGPVGELERLVDKPAIDRFGVEVQYDDGASRMEYAIIEGSEGGATMAARLPAKSAKALQPDLERMLKSIKLSKPVESK